jgi:hypothetical protein
MYTNKVSLYTLGVIKPRNVRIEPAVLSGPIVKLPGFSYHEELKKLPTMVRTCARVAGSVCVAKLEEAFRPAEQLRAAVDVRKLNNRMNFMLLSK